MSRTPLLHRPSESRETHKKIIPISLMSETFKKFKALIEQIESRLEIEKEQPSQIRDNLLRAEIVMLVSAIDYYFYEVVKTGLIDIYNGDRDRTTMSDNLRIPFKYVIKAVSNTESTEWLSESIVEVFGTSAFQSQKQIYYIVQLLNGDFSSFKKAIATSFSTSYKEIEDQLNEIFKRRNQIAHNCDIPKDSDIPQEINYDYTKEKCSFVAMFIENFNKYILLP